MSCFVYTFHTPTCTAAETKLYPQESTSGSATPPVLHTSRSSLHHYRTTTSSCSLSPPPTASHDPSASSAYAPTNPGADSETAPQRPHFALSLFEQHPPLLGLQYGPLHLHFSHTTVSSTSSSFPHTRHSTTTTARSTCSISTTPTATRTSTH